MAEVSKQTLEKKSIDLIYLTIILGFTQYTCVGGDCWPVYNGLRQYIVLYYINIHCITLT